jgi:dinuclear metal center YbgI/SA1388 family protein
MQIKAIIKELEILAPLRLQEDYDNCGLLAGNPEWECSGILVTLDVTEKVVEEAKAKGSNLIVAHHPVIFKGLKKLTYSGNFVERILLKAIKADVAIYAIHTNLDNVITGVNSTIADCLSLTGRLPLLPKKDLLKKLVFFVPASHAETVRTAIFSAGGGKLGNYAECSFYHSGTGTFKPEEGARPFSGELDKRSTDPEERVEIHYPSWLESAVLEAMKSAHPYEEVAYDILSVGNNLNQYGSGLVGNLEEEITEQGFLEMLKVRFGLKIIRHSALTGKKIRNVAVCGGAGGFLTTHAIREKADVFVTSDLKYHDFFDADNRLLLVDIGHWESEQYTIDLLLKHLIEKFPTFAVQKSGEMTNPVHYFL